MNEQYIFTIYSEARKKFDVWQTLISKDKLYSNRDYNHPFYYATKKWLSWYANPHQLDVTLMGLFAPPRSGKTSLGTEQFVSFLLQSQSRVKILLMTASSDTRTQMYNNILECMNCDTNQRIFNPTKSWSDKHKKIFIKQNKRSPKPFIKLNNGSELIIATTLSSVPIGSGFDWIIIDDGLSREIVESPTKYRTSDSKLRNLLGRRAVRVVNGKATFVTKVFLSNQILAHNDISKTLRDMYKQANFEYIFLRYQAQAQQDYSIMLPRKKGQPPLYVKFNKGSFLVPQYNEKDLALQEARLGENKYKNEYLSLETPGLMQIFDPQHLTHYLLKDRDTLISRCVRFGVCVDFAFSEKSSSDYTVCTVFGCDKNNTLSVLDIMRGQFGTMPAFEKVGDFYFKWLQRLNLDTFNCPLIMEKLPAHVAFVEKYRESICVNQFPRQGMSKSERARAQMFRYDNKQLCIPKDHPLTNAIENELFAFSAGNMHDHDDIVDCVVDGLRHIHTDTSF
jgi:phage terminase large subunit-like protein